MSAFGVRAAITAFLLGSLDKTKTRSISLISGAIFDRCVAIIFANFFAYNSLLFLWILAGIGFSKTLADMLRNIDWRKTLSRKTKVKCMALILLFSHLWWSFSTPTAGFLGYLVPEQEIFCTRDFFTLVFDRNYFSFNFF